MDLLLKLFHGTHRFRALVVDDNSDLARLVSILLEHCGFEVRTLANGHAVLMTARVFRPHVILLDIGLPGMDGYQVATLLRDDPDLKSTVIIAAAAYNPDTCPDKSLLAKFDHYLVKPYDFRSLVSLLQAKLL
jgi:CheY-like chemotaxis protein